MSGISVRYTPQQTARITQKIKETLTQFQHVVTRHSSTGEWPTEKDPDHGSLMRMVNEQLKRVRRGQIPGGLHSGWSTELHQLILRVGYQAPGKADKGLPVGKNGLLNRVEAILKAGGTADPSDVSKLRTSYTQGCLAERSAERLRAYGLVIAPNG